MSKHIVLLVLGCAVLTGCALTPPPPPPCTRFEGGIQPINPRLPSNKQVRAYKALSKELADTTPTPLMKD